MEVADEVDFESHHGVRLLRDEGARGCPIGASGSVHQTRLGMGIEKSQQVTAAIQARMVSDQVEPAQQGPDGRLVLW